MPAQWLLPEGFDMMRRTTKKEKAYGQVFKCLFFFTGPPVLSFEERFRAISAVKWVDEVNLKKRFLIDA